MRNKQFYTGDGILKLPSFGIYALTIHEAAELTAKILFLESALDDDLINKIDKNYSLNNPILATLLKKKIDEYKGIILTGVDKQSLKTLGISRNLHDKIDCEKTYVDIDILHDWLQERGLNISGDVYNNHHDDLYALYEAAVDGIVVKAHQIENNIKEDFTSPEAAKIAVLEKEVARLQDAMNTTSSGGAELKTRERDTLLKMIIGMAIDGYGFVPSASRSPTTKEISDGLAKIGISLTDDTVRKWLKKAVEFLPQNTDKH